jgi:Mlc titration factor MtfA (ptsG expression regulator)
MPDTTKFFGFDSTTFDSLQKAELKKSQDIAYQEYQDEKNQQSYNEAIVFGLFVIAVVVFSIYRISKSKENGYYFTRKKWWDPRYYDDRLEEDRWETVYVPSEEEQKATPTRNKLVYDGAELGLSRQEIIAMLQKHYPYYNNLNPIQRGKFVDRLQKFMADKTFIIHSHEGFKEMPVLLSAAAIQLTFGLDKFMLPHFRYLQVHPEEYFADGSFRVLAGNVYDNSITLAWNQFLKGFKNPADGVNVGLHEMAHAVYYQHVVIDKKREMDFCNCFNEVMEEGAEVYELKKEHHVLFTNYAFKDLQEFWAESVELFFEKPFELKANYPELFEAIRDLLNQDPCNSSNPVMTM